MNPAITKSDKFIDKASQVPHSSHGESKRLEVILLVSPTVCDSYFNINGFWTVE